MKDIFEAIVEVAERDGFAESGYRVVNNVGKDGLQTVPHLHFHVLAGRELKIWIPIDGMKAVGGFWFKQAKITCNGPIFRL